MAADKQSSADNLKEKFTTATNSMALKIFERSCQIAALALSRSAASLAVGSEIGALIAGIFGEVSEAEAARNIKIYETAYAKAITAYGKSNPAYLKNLYDFLIEEDKQLSINTAEALKELDRKFQEGRSNLYTRHTGSDPLAFGYGKSAQQLQEEALISFATTAAVKFLTDTKVDIKRENEDESPSVAQVKTTTVSSSISKAPPLVKPVDSSSHVEFAKVIGNKTIPAVESLNTAQAASNLELEGNQAKVEALSETYSWYASSLLSAAESMNDFAQAEKDVVETQSISAEFLATELDKAQLSVDRLAGKSLVDLSNAFAGAIVNGQNFGEALKSIGENILYTVIQMQALSWITSGSASKSV